MPEMLDVILNGAGGRAAQRAGGERSEAAAGSAPPHPLPEPELVERPQRRSFTAEYKRRILREADACRRPGEIGALLRREGLYTSHLSQWRTQRDQGALAGAGPTRGRQARDALAVENERLHRQLAKAEVELAKAHKVIEVQGNVSALLGELLGTRGAKESTEP